MLVFLQFDAAALPLVEQLVGEGRLPALARLRSEGTWLPIDGEATFLQSSTYPTLCTGVDVRDHGLYSAFPWSPSDQRARFAPTFTKPQTIWERLTTSNRRSLVVDPYLAWAPREMAGMYLSGVQFSDRMVLQACSVPQGSRRQLAKSHGVAPSLDDVYGVRDIATLIAWREDLIAGPARAAATVIDLLQRHTFDFLWLNFCVAHKAGHHLWDPAAVVKHGLDSATEAMLRGGLAEVYEAIDSAIGRVLTALRDTDDVIVFSPTGMGPNTSRGDLLPGMLQAVLSGKRTRMQNGRRGVHAPVWSLRARIPAGVRSWIARQLPDSVVADLTTRLYMRADWSQTRAMAVPGENKGYVRLNLRGRERDGIVDPASQEELLDTIVRGLLTFRDPSGAPAIVRVERMAQMAGRPYCDRLPDLVVYWGENSAARLDAVTSSEFGDVTRNGVGSGRSGNHTDDAWAIVRTGRTRLRALDRLPRITDLGATACALLGADVKGLSGESLLDAA